MLGSLTCSLIQAQRDNKINPRNSACGAQRSSLAMRFFTVLSGVRIMPRLILPSS